MNVLILQLLAPAAYTSYLYTVSSSRIFYEFCARITDFLSVAAAMNSAAATDAAAAAVISSYFQRACEIFLLQQLSLIHI